MVQQEDVRQEGGNFRIQVIADCSWIDPNDQQPPKTVESRFEVIELCNASVLSSWASRNVYMREREVRECF